MPLPPRTDRLAALQLEDRITPNGVTLPDPSKYDATSVLFNIAPGADRDQTLDALAASPVGATAQELGFGVFKLDLKPGVTVQQAMDYLTGNGWLGFVEPNYKGELQLQPNDPSSKSGTLWAHNNTGQSKGKADADMDAFEAWTFGQGTGQHVVAVLDSGVDYTHKDLKANMWVNPDPTAPDKYGYDFGDNDPDPQSATFAGGDHGTHVSGTIGAVGNNGLGVVGVAWKTRIMAVKVFADAVPSYTSASLIQGINYAVQHGATIMNGSIGGQYTSVAENIAITGATNAGVLMVFAAGNSALDNDTNTFSPTNNSLTNSRVISVAATDRNDKLAVFSDFGLKSVTLGAPGVEIYSTTPGNTYGYKQGTSMASPQVAGALAVIWDAFPTLSPDELVALLKRSTDPIPALDGITVTGGRLNLNKMFLNVRLGGYAVGADAGGGPVVTVFAPDGSVRSNFYAYDKSFQGGVRVAMADVTGDRVPDIITAPGAGGGPNVRVFDGATLQILYSFQAYTPSFTAGLYVAAGDLDGDGRAELVTGSGEGGGPNVRVYKLGAAGKVTLANSFYAYSAGFTGGVRVTVGDVNNDALKDIVTAPGFGGGPHIRAFSGTAAVAGNAVVLKEFMAGDPRANVGAYVALGNITSDGIADFIVGSGSNDREVRVYDGRTLAFQSGFNVFQPGQSAPRATGTGAPGDTALVGGLLGGVGLPNQLPTDNKQVTATPATPTRPVAGLRVAMLDVDQDGVDDVITAGGAGDQPLVRIRSGRSMTTIGNDRLVFGSGFLGGVFVAASV